MATNAPWLPHIRLSSHNIALALANKGWKVLYISWPFTPFHAFFSGDRKLARERLGLALQGPVEVEAGIQAFTPWAWFPFTRVPIFGSKIGYRLFMVSTRPSLMRVIKAFPEFKKPVLLFVDYPVWGMLPKWIKSPCTVYRLRDLLSGFKNTPQVLLHEEERLIRTADIVFAVSRFLVRHVNDRFGRKIHYLPNGVSEAFLKAPAKPIPDDLSTISPPRLLYVGAIRNWLDVPLLGRIASRHPDWSIILIGRPNADLKSLEGHQNIHVLGERKHTEIPAYLDHADVGLIPFIRDELLEGVSPIKFYEYAARGLPTVAASWGELEKLQVEGLFLARDSEEFELKVNEVLVSNHLVFSGSLRRFVEDNTWTKRVELILGKIPSVQPVLGAVASGSDPFSGS